MLDSFKDVGLSLNGEDGYPNPGFEMDEILDWPRPLRHSGIRMKCS